MFEKNKEKRRQLEFEKDTYFHRRYGIHWEIAKDLVQILHIMIAGVFTLFVMSIITQYDNFSGIPNMSNMSFVYGLGILVGILLVYPIMRKMEVKENE